MMFQVNECAADVVRPKRAPYTSLLPAGTEHEMRDDELSPAAKKVSQRFFPVRTGQTGSSFPPWSTASRGVGGRLRHAGGSIPSPEPVIPYGLVTSPLRLQSSAVRSFLWSSIVSFEFGCVTFLCIARTRPRRKMRPRVQAEVAPAAVMATARMHSGHIGVPTNFFAEG